MGRKGKVDEKGFRERGIGKGLEGGRRGVRGGKGVRDCGEAEKREFKGGKGIKWVERD